MKKIIDKNKIKRDLWHDLYNQYSVNYSFNTSDVEVEITNSIYLNIDLDILLKNRELKCFVFHNTKNLNKYRTEKVYNSKRVQDTILFIKKLMIELKLYIEQLEEVFFNEIEECNFQEFMIEHIDIYINENYNV